MAFYKLLDSELKLHDEASHVHSDLENHSDQEIHELSGDLGSQKAGDCDILDPESRYSSPGLPLDRWGSYRRNGLLRTISRESDSDRELECYNDTSIPWPKKGKKKFTVSVEGNIGCGKSTFLQYFKKSRSVEVIPEPVDMWKSVRGHNTLDLMYKDSQRWSLTFQSYVQLTMLMVHQKKIKAPIKMIERSIHSARYCFVENLHKSGLMPGVDYAVLSEWFDWITKHADIHTDLIVYLQASPETCLQRIKSRNRCEESTVPLEYLESLHELHEDWLIHQTTEHKPAAPVLVLDANKDLSELTLDFERRREEILCGYGGDDKENITVAVR